MTDYKAGKTLQLPCLTLTSDLFFPATVGTIFFKTESRIEKVSRKLKKGKPLAVFWRERAKAKAQPIGLLTQVVKLDGYAERNYQLLLDGKARVRLLRETREGSNEVEVVAERQDPALKEAHLQQLLDVVSQWIFLNRRVSDELLSTIRLIRHPNNLCDLVAHNFISSFRQKLAVLQSLEQSGRVSQVIRYLEADLTRFAAEWQGGDQKGQLSRQIQQQFLH